MHSVRDSQALEQLISADATLVLFGGARCAVCRSIRPKLEAMLQPRFSRLRFVYVDCEHTPEICARYGVFSLPVVKVYIEGMLVAEDARAFGIQDLAARIERPYALWLDSSDEQPR